ncbi:MAG: TolC family protein, partial [Gemmatimonadaceae bacterium]
ATSIPDPTATFAADGISNPARLGGAPSKPAGVELDIPFPDKFRLNARIGSADIRANEHNYRLQQQTVALLASAAYDSLLLARLHQSILRESRDLAADFLKRTEARYNAGTAAKLDQIQAQVTVAQADNDLIGNERDVANAQASLNRILGRTSSAPITPADSFSVPAALPDVASIEQIALTNRPELAIVQEQRIGAKASTSLAREFWLPDLTFGVAHDYAAPGAALFTTGISLPLPIFYWQHAKGDIAQAKHYERELSAAERDTRAQVVQDVRIAYANASTSMRQVVFIRDQLVPAAREAYRIASTSYALGGSSALEVLNARSALLAAQSQLADALSDANTARADLERALGTPVSSNGVINR